MAIAKGIIKRKSDIIVDATHELAKSIAYNPIDYLRKMVGQIFKACEPFYNETFHREDLPTCAKDADIQSMKEYSIALIDALEESGIAQIPAVGNKVSLLKEGLEDMGYLSYVAKDKDAKFGSYASNDIITYIPMADNKLEGSTTDIPKAFGYDFYANDPSFIPEIQIQPSESYLDLVNSTDYYYYSTLSTASKSVFNSAKLGDTRYSSVANSITDSETDSTTVWTVDLKQENNWYLPFK